MTDSGYFNQRENEILDELEQADRDAQDFLVEKLKAKKDRIMEWADRCDKEKDSLELMSRDEISAYMARKMRERNISEGAIRYVREVLPTQFKRAYAFQSTEVNLGEGLVQQFGANPESTTNDELRLKKPVDKMTHAEAIEAIEQVKDYAEDHRSKASHANKIIEAIQEHGEKNKWGDVAKAFKPVRTPTPGAKEGVFYHKLVELGEGILAYAEKVKEYPASPEDDIKYGAATDTYIQELKFVNDLKYTKGARGWMKTIHNAIVGHKHEAAVIHKVVGTVEIETEDPETLEKTKKTVTVDRKLTREAVGDNIEPVILASIKKINAEFFWEAVEDHHDKYMEQFIGIRKEWKHDDLSEKSIG